MGGDGLILTRNQESETVLLLFRTSFVVVCFQEIPTKLRFSLLEIGYFFGLYKTDFIFVIGLSTCWGRVFDKNKTEVQLCYCFVVL